MKFFLWGGSHAVHQLDSTPPFHFFYALNGPPRSGIPEAGAMYVC